MLSPDPVTQAPENGQNYNRYTYAYNNPLKYADPSGFVACDLNNPYCSGGNENTNSDTSVQFDWGGDISDIPGLGALSGNSCDRTCKERKAAHDWCKAQSACLAELRANTREKFRKRSAQVILEAYLTGQSYHYEGGRAHLGDNTDGAGNLVASIELPRAQANERQIRALGKLARSRFSEMRGWDSGAMAAEFQELEPLSQTREGRQWIEVIHTKMISDLRNIFLLALRDTALAGGVEFYSAPAHIALGAVSKAFDATSTVYSELERAGFLDPDYEVYVVCNATGPDYGCTGGIRVLE